MRFYEFEAKKLLAKQGVRLPAGGTADTPEEAQHLAAEIGGPVVLKSQVLSGGRMKAGGVKFAATPHEAGEAAAEILKLPIRDQLPRCVSVEAKAFVKHEYYLGVTYDALVKLPVMIFSDMGGIDIEQVAEEHPDHVAKMHFSSLIPFSQYRAKELIGSLAVKGGELTALTGVMTRLVQAFLKWDMTLAEINPLALLEDGSFVVLDCHLDLE